MDRSTKRQERIAMITDNDDTEDHSRRVKRRLRSLNYKPVAIRIPTLLLFASILAISAGLIEFLLHHTRIPEFPVATTDPKPTSDNRHRLVRRQLSIRCSELPALRSTFSSVDGAIRSLCSDSSKSYAGGTQLNAAQSSNFQQWLGSYAKASDARVQVTFTMAFATSDCYKYNATNAPGLDSVKPASLTNYIGCDTVYVPGPCITGGQITIVSGIPTTITTVVCGVSSSKMLSITSQPNAAKDTAATTIPGPASTSKVPTTTSQSSPNEKSIASDPPAVTTITQPPATQPATTPHVDAGFSATATVTRTIPRSDDIPRLDVATHTTDWVDTVYLVSSFQSSNQVDAASDTARTTPPSNAATLYITGGGTIYTEATQLTSTISTTDRDGHSTFIPVVVVIQATESNSVASKSQIVHTMTTTYTSMVVTTDKDGHSITTFVSITAESKISDNAAPKSQSLYTLTTTYTSMIVTKDQDGHDTTIAAVIVQPTVVTTSPTYSTLIKPTATSFSNRTSTSNILVPSEKVVDRPFDTFSYFAATYLPPLLAVIIKVVWEIVYASFKMIEPFHRMSSHNGSLAGRSLFAQYLSNSVSLDSLKSCFGGHALTMLLTLIYVVVTLLATVAASSMTVRPTANCEVLPGQYMTCNPVWVINTTVLRVLEVLLILCVVLTAAVIASTRHYRSGVSTNPSSIASVATLVNQVALVQDFRTSDPQARGSELATLLRNRKCKLDYHEIAPGTYRYGIHRTLTATLPDSQPHHESIAYSTYGRPHSYTSVPNPGLAPSDSDQPFYAISRRTRSWLWDVFQFLTSAGLFGIVATYRFDFEPDMFNNFFGSGEWYARLVIVAIASVLDMLWKRLEREVRITEPYRRMAKGFQRPETTVLMNLNGTCWSQLAGSLYMTLQYRGMWFQTLVSFVAVLSDFNIIAVASVVWSGGQTMPTFNVSSFLVMSITGLMMTVMLITIFWWRRGVVTQMPRSPSTLGAVFSYLCASRFATTMGEAQVEHLSREERDEMIIATGWRFSFRWNVGLDGRERWVVDYETSPSVRGYQR